MAEHSAIEWTHDTFNPWWGCVKVSPACAHCYAERDAHRYGYDVWGPSARRRFFSDEHWNEPLKWNRAAARQRQRRRVFAGSMCDILEDRDDLSALRGRLWRLIEQTPWLDWLLLSKRPENYSADSRGSPCREVSTATMRGDRDTHDGTCGSSRLGDTSRCESVRAIHWPTRTAMPTNISSSGFRQGTHYRRRGNSCTTTTGTSRTTGSRT